MSTQMKSFLTTLDLVMQDKIEPGEALEEGEIEEILTLDEDGELLSESPAGILVPAGAEAAKRVYQRGMDAKRQSAIAYGKMNAAEEDSKYVDDRYGPDAHSFVAAPPGREKQLYSQSVDWRLGDVEGIPKVADVGAQTHAVDDYSSQFPVPATTIEKLKKIPGWYWDTYGDAAQSLGRGVDDMVKFPPKIAKDLWSGGVKDALTTTGKYVSGQVKGTGDFIKRRYDAAKNIVNSDYTIEDANIILEDYESIIEAYKKGRPRRKGQGRFPKGADDLMSSQEHDEENSLQEINDIRKLSGLEEAVGDSAEALYKLLDELHLEDNILFDELARYLNVDQIKDFVETFRRHHEMPESEHPDGELVHINGKVLPDRIPHEEVDEWLRNTPGGGIAESA
jgi:hypothetical protein